MFEKLDNPLFRNLTGRNLERYEYNRKKVVSWLLAGWPETEERIRTNSLLYPKGSIEAHKKHRAYLKRQFPELPHICDAE